MRVQRTADGLMSTATTLTSATRDGETARAGAAAKVQDSCTGWYDVRASDQGNEERT